MSKYNPLAEQIARGIDRREVLRKGATALFALLTAGAVNILGGRPAEASGCPVGNTLNTECNCTPLFGQYCGGHCSGYTADCPIHTHPWGNGCWCTKYCLNGCLGGLLYLL